MSRKLSTRKRPDRNKHMIREQLKVEEGVFEKRTMMAMWRMFNHNIVSRLDFIIAKGKEADIYVADAGSEVNDSNVILKIFRVETSSFDKRIEYMLGDPRFEKIDRRNIYAVVTTWCRKEYGNLKIAEMAGIHAPLPFYFKDNILAEEFISNDDMPAQTLKNTALENPANVLDTILEDLGKLYGAELVHGDISEYNILIKGKTPYIIDFGQAVVLGHPKAYSFLERDVYNILYYFNKKYSIKRDLETTLAKIKSRHTE